MSLIGTTLGIYRIESQLSVGGMGAIYVAEDTTLHRKVALKVLPPEWANNPDRLERFQWEAQVLATLNHPNIVTIHSVEKHGDLHFFTMELVEGRTLAELLLGGLPLDRLLDYAIPLADALAAAHQQGLIHRDLKPGNVMISNDDRVKVLDFGLAKRESETAASDTERKTEPPATEDGHLMGTVAYMAPEQIYGLPIDHRADIYTLGILLFEMATGERPFQGMDRVNPFSSSSPRPPSRARAKISPGLERVIRGCLQNDPKKRFQTAVEVRDELQDLRLDFQSGVVSTQTRLAALFVGRGRSRSLVMSAAATLVAVAALAFWWTGRGAESAGPATPAADKPKRIVVLPFENLGDPEDEYFAAGVTEEITSRLSSVRALRVISRTTAQHYERNNKTVTEIGEDLGVDFLLEGTVRWSRSTDGSNRVRVTPELVRVADDTHLWSERYDRVIDDIFAVQSQIAEEVIRQLGIALVEPEREVLAAPRTHNLDAYEAYLRGMDYAGRREPGAENWQLAIQMFERAVKLDPDFALAFAELSEVHSYISFLRRDPSEENILKAREAADRALELDPDLPQGHRALAYYHYWCRNDFEAALSEFDMAARHLPNDSQLIEGIAYIRRRQGRFDETVRLLGEAIDLDPRGVWPQAELAATYTHLRRYELADQHYRRAISLAPDQPAPYQSRAINQLLWKGTVDEARAILEEMPRQQDSSSLYFWFRVEVLAGNYQAAQERLQAMPNALVGMPWAVIPKELSSGMVHELSGEMEEAAANFKLAQARLEPLQRTRQDDPRYAIGLGLALAGLGRHQEAIRLGETAVAAMEGDAYFGPAFVEQLAEIYLRAGEVDKALDRLEYLLSVPASVSLPLLRIDPRWRPLWDHPRFKAWK